MEGIDSEEFDLKIEAVFSLATSVSKENTTGTSNQDSALGSADIAVDHDGEGEHDTSNFVYPPESCDSKSQFYPLKDITKNLKQSAAPKGSDNEHVDNYDLTKVKTEPVSAGEESISVCEPCITKDSSHSQFQTESNSGESVSSSDISNDANVERRTCRKRKPNMIFSDNYVLDYKATNSLRDVTITLDEVKLAQRNQLPFKESTIAQSPVVKLETSVSTSEKTKTCTQPKVKEEITSNESCVSQTGVPSKAKHKKTKRQSKYEFERLDDLGNSHTIRSPKRLLSNRVKDLIKSVNRKKRKLYSETHVERNGDLLSSKQEVSSVQEGRNYKHGAVIKTEPISVDQCRQNTSGVFQSSTSELSIPYRIPLSKNEDYKGGDRYSTQYDTNWLIKRNGEMILASMETVSKSSETFSGKDGLLTAAKLQTSDSPSLKVPGSSLLTMKVPISKITRVPVSNSSTLSVPSSTVTRTAISGSLATKVPVLNSLITKEPVSSSAASNTSKTAVKQVIVSETSSKTTQGQKISTVLPLDKENSNKAVEYVKAGNRNYTHTVQELAKVQNTKKFFQLLVGNKVVLIPSQGDTIIPKAYVVDVNKTKLADSSTVSQRQKPSLKIVPDNDIDSPPILSPQRPLVLDFKADLANSKPPVLHPETPVTSTISFTKNSKPLQKSPVKTSPNLKSLLPNIITKSVKTNHLGSTSGDSAETNLIDGEVEKSKTVGLYNASPPMIKKCSEDPAVSNSDYTQRAEGKVVDNSSPELANAEDVSERIRKLREKLKVQQKDVEQARINIKTFKSVDMDDIT